MVPIKANAAPIRFNITIVVAWPFDIPAGDVPVVTLAVADLTILKKIALVIVNANIKIEKIKRRICESIVFYSRNKKFYENNLEH